MAEDLPDEFDVLVIGTGMPESILAAAFSRIGQSVLHIDRNAYYSGQWASFSLKAIEEWIEASQTPEETKIPDVKVDGEQVLLHLTDKSYSKQKLQFHIRDPEPESEERPEQVRDVAEDSQAVDSESTGKETCEADQKPSNSDEVEETEPENKDKNQAGDMSSEPKDEEHALETAESDGNKEECGPQDPTQEGSEAGSPDTNNQSSGKSQPSVEKEQSPLWTESRLKKDWRKFNLDLSPKLLYCGGSMVELLITSDIAKYCEFKTLSRMLTLIDGKLRKVPCSRADVFSSKDVSMIEKRKMMKFLTFCVDYEKHEEDYKEFAEKHYKDFLEHQKLSKNVIHFIQHAISMTSDVTPTVEGLKKTQKFLHSLGRYGNTAFLWPLYGSGEMPQSFCRMCAVFGGVYCLRTPPASLIINPDNVCTGVVMTTGKVIKCKRIVMENSYAPDSYMDSVSNRFVNRGILVTDRSIMSTDDAHQLSMLRLPDDSDTEHPTTFLELPATSMVCPTGLYVIHLTKEVDSDAQSPEETLQPAVTKVFQATDGESPQVLCSLYYQQKINNGGQSKSTPTNVTLVPGPGPEIDIDHSVTIARKIFEEIMPGEDFLPRPPNPEDIIFVDEEETQVTQDSEKTEFNETPQDSAESTAPSVDTENDQSDKSSEPNTTDVTSEQDLPSSSTNTKVDEISESVETCTMEEK
ncbi:rab proteins geranylgeranyltransferase component A 2-like [Crassostrea virginica]